MPAAAAAETPAAPAPRRAAAGAGGGARANETIPQGWSEIMIDPEYDSFFEISMHKEGAYANYERFVSLDGKVLVANSEEGEAPGVYQNVVLKENSVMYVFFQEKVPEPHTITFLTAGDAKASLSNGAFTVTDFSSPVAGYGDMTYTLTPEAGTKVIVNGQDVPAGAYEFIAVGGTITKIQLVKEGFATLACSTDPAEGAAVKSISSAALTIAMSNFENGSGVNIVGDAAANWITVTTATGDAAIATIEPGESEDGVALNINCYSNMTGWAQFEAVKAEIIEHLHAAAPDFGLPAPATPPPPPPRRRPPRPRPHRPQCRRRLSVCCSAHREPRQSLPRAFHRPCLILYRCSLFYVYYLNVVFAHEHVATDIVVTDVKHRVAVCCGHVGLTDVDVIVIVVDDIDNLGLIGVVNDFFYQLGLFVLNIIRFHVSTVLGRVGGLFD